MAGLVPRVSGTVCALSCRLLHGGMSTTIAAPLRRAGCMWSEVKSGLLWLRRWSSLEKFSDRAPMHQVGSDEAGGGGRAGHDPVFGVWPARPPEGEPPGRGMRANGVFGSSQHRTGLHN